MHGGVDPDCRGSLGRVGISGQQSVSSVGFDHALGDVERRIRASSIARSVPTRRLAKAVNTLTRVSAAMAPMLNLMISCLIDAGVRSRCFFSWASVSKTVVCKGVVDLVRELIRDVCGHAVHLVTPGGDRQRLPLIAEGRVFDDRRRYVNVYRLEGGARCPSTKETPHGPNRFDQA